MIRVGFDFSGFNRKLKKVNDAIEAASRPAARAGALVLYNEMKVIAATKPNHYKHKLEDSIYHAFSEKRSLPSVAKSPGYPVAAYVVTYNHGTAPHGWWLENGHIQWYVVRKGSKGWFTVKRPGATGPAPSPRDGRAAMDAYWLPWEHGPRWVEPSPFIRPTWEGKKHEALMASRAKFFRTVTSILQGEAL